jgi:hypothetical protein
MNQLFFGDNLNVFFYPNDFISDWAVKKTLPKKGKPQLPPMPTKEENMNRDPICWDLDSVYNYLLELAESKTGDLTNEMAQKNIQFNI